MNNGAGIPIVACDIDGTLGDYHSHFLRFAADWFGFAMPSPEDINPGRRLSEFMGVSHREYRECKLAYRQGGLKRWMPVYPGAAELARSVRQAGAQFWITTTRPYLRLDNIDPDTREWLRRNDIEYDGVLFGEDKYEELRRQVGGRVVVVFDDLPEACDQSLACGFPTFVRDQPYNQHYSVVGSRNPHNGIGRVFSCRGMKDISVSVIRRFQHIEKGNLR